MADKSDLILHAQLLKENLAWKKVFELVRRDLENDRDRLDYNDEKRMAISIGFSILSRVERKVKIVAQGGALTEMHDAAG